MMHELCSVIFALGSPHGEDSIAWRVADRLLAAGMFKGQIRKVASPYEIACQVEQHQLVFVIDACVKILSMIKLMMPIFSNSLRHASSLQCAFFR